MFRFDELEPSDDAQEVSGDVSGDLFASIPCGQSSPKRKRVESPRRPSQANIRVFSVGASGVSVSAAARSESGPTAARSVSVGVGVSECSVVYSPARRSMSASRWDVQDLRGRPAARYTIPKLKQASSIVQPAPAARPATAAAPAAPAAPVTARAAPGASLDGARPATSDAAAPATATAAPSTAVSAAAAASSARKTKKKAPTRRARAARPSKGKGSAARPAKYHNMSSSDEGEAPVRVQQGTGSTPEQQQPLLQPPAPSQPQPDPLALQVQTLMEFMRQLQAERQAQSAAQRPDPVEADQFRGFTPDSTSANRAEAIRQSISASQPPRLPYRRKVAPASPSDAATDEAYSPLTDGSDHASSAPERDPPPREAPTPEPLPAPRPSVSFASPNVARLPVSNLPEGWEVLRDGMALGEDEGSLVFDDGSVYGPQTIELDLSTYDRPVWRYRTVRGARAKLAKGMIPVKEAYQSILAFLTGDPIAAHEWTESTFHPPGSTSSRTILVGLDDTSVAASFFAGVDGWVRQIARKDKVTWDEASCPANLVPAHFSYITPSKFVKAMAKPQFGLTEHHAALNLQRLPSLPKDAAAEELGARQNFLSCLNASLLAESVLRQQGAATDISPALSAILKATLQPLWSAFCLFVNKRISLREKAIRGCNRENQLVQRLVETNIFSEALFDPAAVEEVFMQAERQAKSVASLLAFRPFFKRKRSASRGQRTPRSKRGGYGGGRASQQGTPAQQSGQGQGQNQQGQSTPAKSYPNTPRRTGYRGRGRGGRSPGTPKKSPASQKANF